MGKLGDIAGEYFFGNKTIESYRKDIGMFREFYDDEELRISILNSKLNCTLYKTIGKMIPNCLSFGGMIYFVSTGDLKSAFAVAGGEFLRGGYQFIMNKEEELRGIKKDELKVQNFLDENIHIRD